MVKYVYDAWGNHKVHNSDGTENTSTNFIGYINPFRYRSYYYDTETGLYYLQSRYYDPEVGRFISIDDTSYLDPETVNGLNLYAYCNNNPVMNVDPTGTAWWNWVAGTLAIIGAVLVIAAITVLTAGVGTTILATTLAGAIIHGAAIGTLIGAGIGIVAGGVIGGAVSGWTADGILTGIGIGFGAGAIIGAIIGGTVGANGWYNAKALEFTHNASSNEVVLGRSGVYEKIAEEKTATYFKMPNEQWNILSKSSRQVWGINKAFLKQQLMAGKNFLLASNPATSGGYYFLKEVAFLSAKAIKYIII